MCIPHFFLQNCDLWLVSNLLMGNDWKIAEAMIWLRGGNGKSATEGNEIESMRGLTELFQISNTLEMYVFSQVFIACSYKMCDFRHQVQSSQGHRQPSKAHRVLNLPTDSSEPRLRFWGPQDPILALGRQPMLYLVENFLCHFLTPSIANTTFCDWSCTHHFLVIFLPPLSPTKFLDVCKSHISPLSKKYIEKS